MCPRKKKRKFLLYSYSKTWTTPYIFMKKKNPPPKYGRLPRKINVSLTIQNTVDPHVSTRTPSCTGKMFRENFLFFSIFFPYSNVCGFRNSVFRITVTGPIRSDEINVAFYGLADHFKKRKIDLYWFYRTIFRTNTVLRSKSHLSLVY